MVERNIEGARRPTGQTLEEMRGNGARVYRAPGRVNLIGEHTDYNDGFVMPAAINLYTYVAIAPRSDRRLLVTSDNFSENIDLALDEPDPPTRGHWSDYIRGVAVMLERAGYLLRGAELAIRSDIPIGGGLSSSAAIEVATACALLGNSGFETDRRELPRLCQRAENDFVGMRCGIMDQFISTFARAGHALMLDCRSLEFSFLPLPEDVRLVICNTMVKHALGSSEYNARRAECEAGVRHFARLVPGVQALRDVSLVDLEEHGSDLPEVVYKRCRHVTSENDRVLDAAAALEVGDLTAFGKLMADSHRSLRNDYEVSCAELDIMVDLATQVEGVFGARMTGGGFGGCTINLVRADRVAAFKQEVSNGYERATGITPETYSSLTADGAGLVG
jgi:galactokinase